MEMEHFWLLLENTRAVQLHLMGPRVLVESFPRVKA